MVNKEDAFNDGYDSDGELGPFLIGQIKKDNNYSMKMMMMMMMA
jgi:hypothetical protein